MPRQPEEDTAAGDFDREAVAALRFGNWPELVGLLLAAGPIWMSFAFRG